MDKEKLALILQRNSKTLCNSKGDRIIAEATNNRRNNKNISTNYNQCQNSFDDYQQFDNMLNEESINMTNDIYYTNNDIQNSHLSDAIKKSFSEQHINMTDTGGLSILDSLPIQESIQYQPKQKKILNESNNISYSNNSFIDYSIIKAIINECLKEYFEKQQINENAELKTIALKEGNISLVDNKGNIYKAKLEKIGNKNDKK